MLAAFLTAASFLPAAPATTLTGNLQARLTLTAGCLVVGAPGSTTGINFGTLDFGSQASSFVGTIAAVATGGATGVGSTQVLCSPDVSGFSISIDGGTHAGQGTAVGVGTRSLRNGSAYLPYEIYQDVAHTVAYPVGGALAGFSIPSDGSAFNLPIFGQVNKTSSVALPSGTYTDTLVVTLTF